MAKAHFSNYHKKDLAGLAELLLEEYYIPIIAFSDNIARLTAFLKEEAHPEEVELLINLCAKLSEETEKRMQERKNLLVPYLKELYHKTEEGHNCASCSGKCSIQHQMHLPMLRESHHKIKELLYHILQLFTPLSIRERPMNHFKFLLEEIRYIDDAVTELFFVEEAIIIPKIKEAQSAIHIHK